MCEHTQGEEWRCSLPVETSAAVFACVLPQKENHGVLRRGFGLEGCFFVVFLWVVGMFWCVFFDPYEEENPQIND